MSDRDKLFTLIRDTRNNRCHWPDNCDGCKEDPSNVDCLFRLIADELIANGVVVQITGETSDGYHTFNELYHHRAVLFSVICNVFPELAWKSKQHDDPASPMYEGMFIVGIQTPAGQATYHYDIEPYWDMFHVKELERAPVWDGHTPAEAIRRIGMLVSPKEDKHGSAD